jgi:hypothetical protein
MPRRCVLLLAALLFVPALRADEGKPVDLFNGKNLDGWVVEGAGTFKRDGKTQNVWVARDGLLSCVVSQGSYGFLRYAKKPVADFRLSLDYRFHPVKGRQGNSGVGIRTVPFDPKKSGQTRPSAVAYEVQLLDDAGAKPSKHGTASLYKHVAPSEQAARPGPQWNTLVVECVGPRIKITLNGKKVVDVDQSAVKTMRNKPLKGYINLQNHGAPVDFRNIRLTEISPAK